MGGDLAKAWQDWTKIEDIWQILAEIGKNIGGDLANMGGNLANAWRDWTKMKLCYDDRGKTGRCEIVLHCGVD